MELVHNASELFPHPYENVSPFKSRARYNFYMGSRASLKSSIGGMLTATNMEVDKNTSIMYILKQKNKHANTTYKAIRNAMRKLGTFDTWNMSGSEKSVPYIWREDPITKKRQEILFRGVSTPEDIDKVLSLEGDRTEGDGKNKKQEGTRWIIIFDEVQTIKTSLSEIIFSKLDESIRGNVTGLPHQFFFLGNPPKAKKHFFNMLFNSVFGTNKMRLKSIMENEQYQEAYVKNFLGGSAHFLRTCYLTTPKEYVGEPLLKKFEYYKEKVNDKYLRECLGIFVDGGGEVFDQFTQERNVFNFQSWVDVMGGEARAKHDVHNMMKSGVDMFFENANTTFLEELEATSKQLGMTWLKIYQPQVYSRTQKKVIDGKEKVETRTAGINAGFETRKLMVSDRCPRYIEEVQEATFDESKKEKDILVRMKENDHGLDGVEYTLSGDWVDWQESRLIPDFNKLQRTIKFVCGGDFGDGGASKEGNGASTCYVAGWTAGYARAYILDEFYWKNKELEEHKRIGSKQIAIKMLLFIKAFAEGKW